METITIEERQEQLNIARQIVGGLDYTVKLAQGKLQLKRPTDWTWLEELKKEAEKMKNGL
ncbi:hypothetical protein FACS189490_13930 [Clostridia bacterium]|nr:hypothetical protein FACS189490_13930 [Clostridia bacterium]